MHPEFLPNYRSPDGSGPLELVEVLEWRNGEVIRGRLRSRRTGAEFPIEDGAPRLIVPEELTPARAVDQRQIDLSDQQIDRWIAEQTLSPELTDAIRIHDEEKFARTEFLFQAFDYDSPGEKYVLDLGCGDPSLTLRFAQLGFRCFALDFAPYRLCHNGGRYIEDSGQHFERVVALMSRLPFPDRMFDLVFVSAALHHATPNREDEFEWYNPRNMFDTLREVKRVLKRHDEGGRFIAAGEGVYPDDMPVSERPLEKVAKVNGCYESHYTMAEYLSQFEAAGIYPMFFANQLDRRLYFDGYLPDGTRLPLLRPDDGVTMDQLWRMRHLCRRNATAASLREVLPDWMHFRRLYPWKLHEPAGWLPSAHEYWRLRLSA
ncbi:MAG: class I SAM-dependent methyltransferase [Planctomycetia bacterium]|nr:class I SAM-dependent methyltransferase [Planctomycetia bacterium]